MMFKNFFAENHWSNRRVWTRHEAEARIRLKLRKMQISHMRAALPKFFKYPGPAKVAFLTPKHESWRKAEIRRPRSEIRIDARWLVVRTSGLGDLSALGDSAFGFW